MREKIICLVLSATLCGCALQAGKAAPPADTRDLAEAIEFSSGPNPFLALEWKDIYLFLDTLAPATRIVCNLFYLEAFSIRDISTELHLSPGTVKWHLSETRKKLKPILQRHYHIQPK